MERKKNYRQNKREVQNNVTNKMKISQYVFHGLLNNLLTYLYWTGSITRISKKCHVMIQESCNNLIFFQ